ncbi:MULTISPECIES: glycosyltransferase family 2 protein [Clostridia]|uniref:glycosyltransferase family 2 protein n=1 Tax=Clostridia TaxID=186801 RepID=UPI000EA39426|nr:MULTISPECIES: glycosyltransferase family 2 protein [Clostridia]NBJ71550.1 glycosyltransferase family 2 protein [Roseburia sp. 1XD42-34]RKI74196.1 glycosyltransferase family 2 protein [Clostridium sp. 1xD42-85]
MKTISLSMIVKNEEEVLEQCLSSVADICDEIIILDTGSTDQTKEIAAKFTDKVIDFEWIYDFSAARNKSFSYATKDFIMFLDADDVVLPEDLEKLKQLKQELTDNIDAVSMYYHTAFDDQGNPTFKFRRNRLVKRSNHFKWYGAVHEYLEVSGNIYYSDIAITHRKQDKSLNPSAKGRNLDIYERQLKKGITFTPREMFYYANELKDHQYFGKAIDYYHQFLDTKRGWIEDEIRACIYIADCYKALGKTEQEIDALLQSLKYDLPRPEVLCRLGDYYKNQYKFHQAIRWYMLALTIEVQDDSGFTNTAYTTWYPHIQMCVCYWQLGDKHKSHEHHLKVKEYNPHSPLVKNNEKFFEDFK